MDAVEHDAVASGQRKAASFVDNLELMRTHPLGVERQQVRAPQPATFNCPARADAPHALMKNIERLLPAALKLYEASRAKAAAEAKPSS